MSYYLLKFEVAKIVFFHGLNLLTSGKPEAIWRKPQIHYKKRSCLRVIVLNLRANISKFVGYEY